MTDPGETEAEEAEDATAESQVEVELRYGVPVCDGGDMEVLYPSADQWLETAAAVLDDGFVMCVDVTAVDYLSYSGRRSLPTGVAPERFEVSASFLSLERRQRIRVKAQVAAGNAEIASLSGLFPGADFMEREAFDMFGILFTDHPDLSRILMPEDWEGYPLRKDYDTGAIPVQFKGAPGAR